MSCKRHTLGECFYIRNNFQQPIDTQSYTVALGQASRQRVE